MAAAGDAKHDIAPLYLNSRLKGQALHELADQLYTVLNSRLPVRLNVLSDRPEGSLANPLTPDRDVVGTIPTARGELPIALERVDSGDGKPIWLFASSTLAAVPEVFREGDLFRIDPYLPAFLTYRIAGIRLFEWLLLALIVPLLYRLLGALSGPIRIVHLMWRRRSGDAEARFDRVPGSVRVLLLAVVIRSVIPRIDLPLAERRLWALVAGLLTIGGVVWLLLLCIDRAEAYVQRRVRATNLGESRALLRLARRMADGLVLSGGGLVILAYFGIDPTAALAGLGIGGIAVALAAQKTLENVIGGFSIVFDGAVRVGDVLKLGESVGTVDHVGLRSTRIRTVDRTIMRVPNGQIATANIETLSDRDKFRFHHVVGLGYTTTAAQMRAISAGVRDLLVGSTGVDVESVRVQFFRLGPSSLDIEVFAYILAAGWGEFLAVQQDLLLRIMEIVEQSGTGIAFPTQIVHLRDESGDAVLSKSARPRRPARRKGSPDESRAELRQDDLTARA
jgi:MscS family membrane protein